MESHAESDCTLSKLIAERCPRGIRFETISRWCRIATLPGISHRMLKVPLRRPVADKAEDSPGFLSSHSHRLGFSRNAPRTRPKRINFWFEARSKGQHLVGSRVRVRSSAPGNRVQVHEASLGEKASASEEVERYEQATRTDPCRLSSAVRSNPQVFPWLMSQAGASWFLSHELMGEGAKGLTSGLSCCLAPIAESPRGCNTARALDDMTSFRNRWASRLRLEWSQMKNRAACGHGDDVLGRGLEQAPKAQGAGGGSG